MNELLLVLLTAAPVEVVVVNRPDAQAALTRALPGTTLVDARAVHTYLHTRGMLMNDFSEFKAPPIAGWPPELAEFWKASLAYCAKIAGPPPWNRDNVPTIVGCSERLTGVLWQKLLDHVAARRVYELSVEVDRKTGSAAIGGTTYEPRGTSAVTVTTVVAAKDLAGAIDKVVADLVAQRGKSVARAPVFEMGATLAGDPLAKEEVVETAVPLKKTCDALPSQLTLSDPSVLARSIAARWKASSTGAKAPVPCTLAITRRSEAVMGQPLSVLSAVLECGPTTASAESSETGPMMKTTATANLSKKLVETLAARYCKDAP